MVIEIVIATVAGLSLGICAVAVAWQQARRRQSFLASEAVVKSQSIGDDPARIAEEVRRAVAVELDRAGSFQRRVANELESVVSSSRSLQKELEAMVSSADPGSGRPVIAGERRETDRVIRELSHCLGTPLARIRAEAELLRTEPGEANGHEDRIARMSLAVDVCQAFLFAFRRLGAHAETGTVFESDRLEDVISSLGDLFSSADGKGVSVVSQGLPEHIPNYSTGFVLAAVAPLIENAVEASPTGGVVEVGFSHGDDRQRLSVSNTCEVTPQFNRILDAGVTSKPGHEGLGLPTVQHLLASVDGQLSYEFHDSDVVFTVELPRGDESDR